MEEGDAWDLWMAASRGKGRQGAKVLGEGDRLTHHTGVLAPLQVSSTQHDVCHLLGVGFGTQIVGQEFKVYTLELIWELNYGPGRDTAVADPAWPRIRSPLPCLSPRSGLQAAPAGPAIRLSGSMLPQPEA